jgi:hypothetical protein
VDNATPEECSVHSGFNCPKIDATKEHFVTYNVFFANEPPDAAVGSSQETILAAEPHDYKYIPQVWLHADYNSDYNGNTAEQFGPGEAFIKSGAVGDEAYVGVRADRDNYYVYIRKVRNLNTISVVGMRLTLRVYVFADTAYE